MALKLAQRLVTEAGLALLLVGWFVLAGRVPEFILPQPQGVFRTAVELLTDPGLLNHTIASLARVLIAVALAGLIGAALVMLAHYVPLLRGLINQRITPFFNAFPTLGWAMLAVLWFKISDAGVVFVQVSILLPFVLVNLWEGVDNLDPGLLEMGRSFARRESLVLLKVIAPLLAPYAFAALRLCYGVSWKIALIAEIFGTNRGLGYLMAVARANFDSQLLFAAILVVIIMVFAGDRLIFAPLQRRLSAWRSA